MLVHVPMLLLTSPDDEEYLTEWDEWSEVEKGRGPKASWSGEVWSTLSGEISRFSMATPGESTMIKNGKCVNVKNVKNIATDDDEYIPFPTMPCTSASNQSHRTKIPSGGLGSKLFTMQWFHDLCAELRLSLTQRPKKRCSRSGKAFVIKRYSTLQWFVSTTMLLQRPRRTKGKYIWPGSMVYAWKRITSCQKTILDENSREEAFC